MSLFALILGFLIGGALLWWMTRGLEKQRHLLRVQLLEAKVRLSSGQVTQLQSELHTVRSQVGVLRENLVDERKEKAEVIGRLTHSFKKGIVFMGAGALVFGLSVGGGFSWQVSKAWSEARNITEKAQLTLNAQVAELKVEVLENRLQAAEAELNRVKQTSHEKVVENAVLETKLRILLRSLTPHQGGGGFSMDHEKLQKNLRKEIETQALQDIAIIKSAASYR